MHQARPTLERLSRSFPQESDRLRQYFDRIEAYSHECGCSMGAIFLVGSLGLLILYGVFFRGFGKGHLIAGALWGPPLAFTASMVGKLTGIGIARARLFFLLRHLRIHYPVTGD